MLRRSEAYTVGPLPMLRTIESRSSVSSVLSPPSSSVRMLRLDVHDNFVGQDRRTCGSKMGDRLAMVALNVNQRKPAIQALRRGVVP